MRCGQGRQGVEGGRPLGHSALSVNLQYTWHVHRTWSLAVKEYEIVSPSSFAFPSVSTGAVGCMLWCPAVFPGGFKAEVCC